jgi:hypothetical protein
MARKSTSILLAQMEEDNAGRTIYRPVMELEHISTQDELDAAINSQLGELPDGDYFVFRHIGNRKVSTEPVRTVTR